MASLTRWNPFAEMVTLQEAMNQLLSDSVVRPQTWATAQPATDVYETEQEFVVRLMVPGFRPEDIEITMQENMLTVRGRRQDVEERQAEEREQGARYLIQEQRFVEFSRSIQFPSQVDAENIRANLSNGILTIHVPKAQAALPRRISVEASDGGDANRTIEAGSSGTSGEGASGQSTSGQSTSGGGEGGSRSGGNTG